MRGAFVVVVVLLLGGCGSSPRAARHASDGSAAGHHPPAVAAEKGPCQKGCFVPLRQRWQYLNISPGQVRPAAPFLLGGRLQLTAGGRSYVLPGRAASLCTTVVPSLDGRYVIYGVNAGRWLKLELLNVRTGRRSTFRNRACGVAWGEHDEIAYTREESPNPQGNDLFRGRIVVQHGLRGHAKVWTGGGEWTGLTWAGTHLLAVDQRRDAPFGRLVISSGSARERTVAAVKGDAGPFLSVVAVSPSGRDVLLDEQRVVKGGGEDLARLVRVRDGRTLATLRLSGPPAGSGLYQGSWRAGHVIATNGYFDGGSSYPLASLTQLTITGHRLRLDWTRFFLERGYELIGQDSAFAGRPRYLTANLRQVAVWFSAGHGAELRYARCDTLTGACPASRDEEPNDINAGSITGEFVSNPSRPLRP